MLAGRSYNKKFRAAKRHAYQLSHFKFKTRLINRCKQLENCKLLIVSEAYTTKTCSCCGWIWENMTTKDRIFKCKQCDLVIDRDVNAAVNIVSEAIREFTSVDKKALALVPCLSSYYSETIIGRSRNSCEQSQEKIRT